MAIMDGKGLDGPVKCIFLCKFHPKLGPVVTCQYPDNYILKDVFEAIHNYLITKIRIKKKTITLSVFGLKVTGYPNEILNSKYLRNALIYNLCFVCDYNSRTIQYEPVVKKISEWLENLELENGFLSSDDCGHKLPPILKQILEDINSKGFSTIYLPLQNTSLTERKTSCRMERNTDGDLGKLSCKLERNLSVCDPKRVESYSKSKSESSYDNKESKLRTQNTLNDDDKLSVSVLNLKQFIGVSVESIQVEDHHVPFLLYSGNEASRTSFHWDLTTQQILPYIDGVSHIGKIASNADVLVNLVKACVRNLVHYKMVKILPIFQYSNFYTTLPGLQKLYTSVEVQEECLRVLAKSPPRFPLLSDVMKMYSSLTYGVSVRDMCLRFKPHELNVDERHLVQFGLLYGFIRRIHQYPVLTSLAESDCSSNLIAQGSSMNALFKVCNGCYSIDEMCCKFGMTHQEIMDRLDKHPDLIFILK